MRKIERIFIHCTAGSQKQTLQQLEHEFYKVKKWKNPGYHYVVFPDGGIVQMLSENKVSNGVQGYNSTAINVAYVGGIDANGKGVDNRTNDQKRSLRLLVKCLKGKYPQARIMGHRDISPDKNHNGVIEPSEWIKMCPCFDAKKEYESISGSSEKPNN